MKFIILTFLIFLTSCSSGVKKEIETEKAKIEYFKGNETLGERIQSVLEGSGLTEEQKELFIDVHHKVMGKTVFLNDEIKKLKMVLIRNLSNKKYSEKKTEILTERIKTLYGQKIEIMLEALGEVKQILGKDFQKIDVEQRFLDGIHKF